MHKDILTDTQKELLPLVKSFSQDFRLVGGTAIAFQIGHRRSIDFDLFSEHEFDNADIAEKITEFAPIEAVKTDQKSQYTLSVNGVQFTFVKYRFKIPYDRSFENVIKMPDLLTLAAMKLHALGRRGKWKDYVDLYFILKDYHTTREILNQAKHLFANECNDRDMRIQLAYHHFLDYSDKVEFMPGFEVRNKEIQERLTEWSLL